MSTLAERTDGRLRLTAGGIAHAECARAPRALCDPNSLHVMAVAYANDHLTAETAAREGNVDELVGPGETRERLAGALAALSIPGRCGNGPGNIPL